MTDPFHADITRWIAAHPGLSSVQVALVDINGALRGKRIPVADIGKAVRGQVRMPLTVAALDIWGRDIAGSPFMAAGDGDGLCHPTGRLPIHADWLAHPTAILPVWSHLETGAPSPIDARQALAAQVARAAEMGFFPVVGVELEFYVLDPAASDPSPPLVPGTGRVALAEDVNSIPALDGFEGLLADVFRAAEAAGIAVDSASAEASPGQFELTLGPADALTAADNAIFLKHIVRGVARAHGLAATFMAKPYLDGSGNGLHLHMSLLDADGRNAFDDGGAHGTPRLAQAAAGCLQAMAPLQLIFAPHLNSYRRFVPDAHAPIAATWAYENRFTALRVPGGSPKARRLEHRVAGADANPHLVTAAVLGGALDGIEAKATPPDPGAEGARFATNWPDAIQAFRASDLPARLLGAPLAEIFADAKAQELERFRARMTHYEIETYLDTV